MSPEHVRYDPLPVGAFVAKENQEEELQSPTVKPSRLVTQSDRHWSPVRSDDPAVKERQHRALEFLPFRVPTKRGPDRHALESFSGRTHHAKVALRLGSSRQA